jgi:hypothetical protein
MSQSPSHSIDPVCSLEYCASYLHWHKTEKVAHQKTKISGLGVSLEANQR